MENDDDDKHARDAHENDNKAEEDWKMSAQWAT